MTIFLLILIASGLTLGGAAYGRYIARNNQASRLGWIGLIIVLVLIAALLYATQTRQEALTYLFGALIMLTLVGLLFAAIGEFLGKRAYRLRDSRAAGDDERQSSK
jgi:Na+/proline symporter